RRRRVGDAGARGRFPCKVPLQLRRRLDVPPEHVPAPPGIRAAADEGSRVSASDDLWGLSGDLSREGAGFLHPRSGEEVPEHRGGRGIMSARYSEVVQTARDYYNSDDADNFYFHVWGGEDIHIGLYESENE